jgi:membrane protease YdiL (CAAX protease family)
VIGTRGPIALFGAVPLAIGAGLAEEVALRGVVFRVVEEWLGTAAALAISALLFGLLHLGNPHATWWSSLAIAIEAGVLLAVAFTVTRRLWLPIGIHAAWNWTQSAVFGAAVSGTSSVGWLRGQLHGPEILTGGEFGPEASLPAVVICLAVAVVLFRRRRPLSRPS